MPNPTRNANGIYARALLWLSALMLLAGTAATAQAQPGKASPEETCKACHAEYVNTYALSKHSVKTDGRTPANRGGCLACHGDGALEHAKKGGGRGVGGIINPGSKTLAADDKNAICLTCHQGGKRMQWSTSLHANRDTACTSCHKVHTTNDKVRVKETQAQVCFTCHKEQRAQISRPYRHPIEEGKVVCSDCHNPHGSAGPKNMVRDSVNDTCYTCHMDKRGPFVRSHQPVQEDCSICHNPHGSTYPFMVKIRIPFLCQSCHDQSSHHDGEAALRRGGRSAVFEARGCENCHTQIHGSNAPSAAGTGTGRAFRR